MALTDNMRERAFGLFAEGVPTEKVASRIRQSVESTRALRANWTRNLTEAQRKKVAKKVASYSSSSR